MPHRDHPAPATIAASDVASCMFAKLHLAAYIVIYVFTITYINMFDLSILLLLSNGA